jgi:endonuclease YncB( thermonuclease family)
MGGIGLVAVLAACSGLPPLTAEQVTTQLTVLIPTATLTDNYTADTDPNKLLGRPGGYISKAAFKDTRAVKAGGDGSSGVDGGGSVEVYADKDGASSRREYLQDMHTKVPLLGTEYDYQQGPILLRVSHYLNPDQAGEYAKVLADIADGKVTPASSPAPAPVAAPAAPVAPAPLGAVTVASVHDATTIVLSDGTRLRQAGISAPNADSCQAKQATTTTDTEVRKGPLTYQLLGQADVYGNQWATLQVNGSDFGEKLASLGWVWAYPDSPATQEYNQRIANQVDVARVARAGMFGTTCPGALPATPGALGAAPAQTISNGTFVVGVDIQPGIYRTSGPDAETSYTYCSWSRLKDTTGESASVIASDNGQGPMTVTIKPTDGAFKSEHCTTWTKMN